MSNDLALFEKSLSIGSLGAYVHWVNQLPMLSLEEEQELTHRLKEFNDLEAARKLVLSHLRLVVKVARGYGGYGLQQADLVQEGNIGLMKAVKRFDPAVGVRLMSYAIHWIRAEIHEFVIKNWRIVKVATTKAQRKLFFNLRRLAKSNTLSEAEVDIVAKELNVSEKDVRTMAQRLHHNDDVEYNGADYEDDSHSWKAPANRLSDQSSNPALQFEHQNSNNSNMQQLHSALQTLDAREQDILQSRWLTEKKTTLQVLAERYDVSIERVRQIEQRAMSKLREQIGEQ